MTFINKFKYLGEKSPIFGKYSLHLNELLRASCPTPFGPAKLFKFDRSPLMRSYGYASAGDQSTLFTIFPLNFVPFMHYAG
jgi:hypothetical protein